MPQPHIQPDLDSDSARTDLEPEVLDTVMRVTTPENISFQYRLAGPFRRICAYLIDVFISIVGYVILVIILSLLSATVFAPLANMLGLSAVWEAISGLFMGMIFIGLFIVYWFYGALLETYANGQTLGKRWTRLRVLSTNGHSIDGAQATLRNFFRLLDIMPFVSISTLLQLDEEIGIRFPTCLIGLLMMGLSKKFQRVGDMVADTVVVCEELKTQPHLVVFTDQRVPGLAELIPAGFVVSPGLAKAIADYADQRRYLSHPRRSKIASHLSEPLLEKFDLMPDTDPDLFLCALYHKTFIATQNGDETPHHFVQPVAVANSGFQISPIAATAEKTVAAMALLDAPSDKMSEAMPDANPDETDAS